MPRMSTMREFEHCETPLELCRGQPCACTIESQTAKICGEVCGKMRYLAMGSLPVGHPCRKLAGESGGIRTNAKRGRGQAERLIMRRWRYFN